MESNVRTATHCLILASDEYEAGGRLTHCVADATSFKEALLNVGLLDSAEKCAFLENFT